MSSHGFRMKARWQIGLRYSALSPNARFVGLVVSTWMDPEGRGARPGWERISDGTGLARSSVYRALEELERAGWIHRSGRGGRGITARIEPRIPEAIDAVIERHLNRPTGGTEDAEPSRVGDPFGEKPSRSWDETVPERQNLQAQNRPAGDTRAFEPNKSRLRPTPDGAEDEDHVDPWTERGISFGDWLRELREQARKARLDGAIGAPDLTEAAG